MPVARIRTPDGRVMRIQANSPEEAMKLAQQTLAATTDAVNRQKSAPSWERAIAQGLTLGSSDEMDARAAQLETFLNPKAKYTPKQAYDAVMATQGAKAKSFEREHPATSATLNIGGGIAGLLAGGSELAGLVKGGGKAVSAIPGIGGLLASKGLLPASLRAAAGGGLLGGVTGAATADPGQRLQGAENGAMAGAVMGGATPAAGVVLAPVARVAGRVANKVTGGGFNAAVNATSKAMGGADVVSPQQTATSRIIESLKRDGLGPDQLRAATNEWLRVGGASPAFMDIVRSSPSGGESTFGLIRGAALKGGPARSAAVKYSDQVAGDLQDNAINRTRQLTPDTRPAQTVADELAQRQSTLAGQEYATPYAQQVQPTDDVAQALGGGAGRAALTRARSAAEAQMRPEQVADIDRLMSGDMSQPVSAATLDRLKIAMRERGEQAARRGANDMRAGLQARTGMIDSGLDDVEGLADARAHYAELQRQQDAIPIGQAALHTAPDDFSAGLRDASPETLGAAGIGYRQAMTDAIGSPAEGSTGILNRLSTSTNQGQNLTTAFGQQPAQDYQQSVGNMVDQLRNAREINPSMGSRTAVNLVDLGEQELPTSPKAALIKGALNAVKGLTAPTDAERAAIVNTGIAPAQSMTPEIVRQLEDRLRQRFGLSAPAALIGSEQGARQ